MSIKNRITYISSTVATKVADACTAAIAGARDRRYYIGRKLRPLELADEAVARMRRLVARTDKATAELCAAVQRADNALNSATIAALSDGAAATAAEMNARSSLHEAKSTEAHAHSVAALTVAVSACPALANAGDAYPVAPPQQPTPA